MEQRTNIDSRKAEEQNIHIMSNSETEKVSWRRKNRRNFKLYTCLALIVALSGFGMWKWQFTDNQVFARGTSLQPVDGLVYSGAATNGTGSSYDEFLQLSGQNSLAITHRFSEHSLGSFGWIIKEFNKRDSVGMISWWMFESSYSTSKPGGTNQSISNGDIDSYILARAKELRDYGKPIFLRPNWEMNGNWFPWSAYDKQGNQKTGNSHADFRKAWQRAVIIFEGGSKDEVNSKLKSLGMPALNTNEASIPNTANVSWVWNPNYNSSGKDSAHPYWPGDSFVDWSGLDWYGWGTGDSGMHTSQATRAGGPNELYDRYSGPNSSGKKPFMIGEWGVYGQDRPIWVDDMFNWIEQRPQVKAAIYFNHRASDDTSHLADFPKSKDAFKKRIVANRYIKSGTLVQTQVNEISQNTPGTLPTNSTQPPNQLDDNKPEISTPGTISISPNPNEDNSTVNINPVLPPDNVTIQLKELSEGQVVSGILKVEATPSGTQLVDKVDFYINNQFINSENIAPYNLGGDTNTVNPRGWDTKNLQDGIYTFRAVLFYGSNQKTEKSVSIKIANTTPLNATVSQSIQAETATCQKSCSTKSNSLATGGKTLSLNTTGSRVSYAFKVTKAGTYRIGGTIKSQDYKGQAKVAVYLNGKKITTKTANSGSFGEIDLDNRYFALNSTQKIEFEYINDYNEGSGKDRDLLVDTLFLKQQ